MSAEDDTTPGAQTTKAGRTPDDAETGQEKMTVRLGRQAYTTVRDRAAKKGVSLNEFARQALGTKVYLMNQVERGARILIERPDKTVRELVLR